MWSHHSLPLQMCSCPQTAPAQSEAGSRATMESTQGQGEHRGSAACPPLLGPVSLGHQRSLGRPGPPRSMVLPEGTGGLSARTPHTLACFCLCQSKFLNCIWSLVTTPGKGLLGIGGFHLLLCPRTGFTAASRLAEHLPRLPGQAWSEWGLFWDPL